MPRVPTYDNFTVAPVVNPDVRVNAPEFQDFGGQQAAKASTAMIGAGASASRIIADMQNDANAVRVDDGLNKANEAALALTYDKANGFTSIKGESALNREGGQPLAVEYKDKLQAKISEISEKLGNDTQRKLFAMKANDLITRFYGSATAHETQQMSDYTLSVQEGKMKNASNAIVLDPLSTDNVKNNIQAINQAIYTTGKVKGFSAEQITAAQREALSQTHMNVVKSLLEKENVDGAAAYFKTYEKQLSGVQVADAQKMLNQADNAKVAISTSNQLWSEMGPTKYGEPVDIYKMERKAQEMFPDSPTKSAAVITELRNRKAAFDASENEFITANTNSVGKLMMSGKTLNQIKASPQFNALPGAKQNEISNFVTDRNHMLWARSEEDKVRLENIQARKFNAEYLAYTDPNVLIKMKRADVEALYPKLGMDHTQTLVGRWDTLQNKDALETAKLDSVRFNTLAQEFGLRPNESNKSESSKNELAILHDNVNQVLTAAAKGRTTPLSDSEKDGIFRKEMAKTVTVNGFFSNTIKPVAQLNEEEKSKIIVPPDARKQISEQMATRYQATKDPVFAPTEENLRGWYLNSVRNKK